MTRSEGHANPRAGWALVSPPHGFSDDDATRRLLRSRPPQQALDWAGGVLGGTVVSSRALRGGMSSAVHALTVSLPGGGKAQVVLRRYVRPEVNAEDPDIAEREALVLHLVEAVDVPTPRLVAVDPTGREAEVPAVLMSRLPGRVEWSPADLDRWLGHLAELLRQSTRPCCHPPACSATSPLMPKSATTLRGGRAGRPSGNGRSRLPTHRPPTWRPASSTATAIPATCCGDKAR